MLFLASGYASQYTLSLSTILEIGKVVVRRHQGKYTSGCVTRLTLTLVCEAAAGLLVVIQ